MHNTLRERNVFGSLWKCLQMNNERTVVKSTMCILREHQIGIHRISMIAQVQGQITHACRHQLFLLISTNQLRSTLRTLRGRYILEKEE